MGLVKKKKGHCKYHVQYKILLQLQNFLLNSECLPLLWGDICCRLIYAILSLPRKRLTSIAVACAHLQRVQEHSLHCLRVLLEIFVPFSLGVFSFLAFGDSGALIHG